MSKSYKVTPEFRSNNLHEKGGGYQVFVVYRNNTTKVYDNVQYPHGYIRKIKENIRNKLITFILTLYLFTILITLLKKLEVLLYLPTGW